MEQGAKRKRKSGRLRLPVRGRRGVAAAVTIAVGLAMALNGVLELGQSGSRAAAESAPASSGTVQEAALAPEGTEETEAEEPQGPTAAEQRAAELLAGMTLREKVCQMMMVTPTGITGVKNVTIAGEATHKALETYPVGGLDYDKSNMKSQSQIEKMLSGVQEMTKVPLLLTCDEEGGRVARLMRSVGTTQVDAMLTYKDQGPEKAEENAGIIAADMAALGFNMDLAPVADVLTNPKNTVIGDRAYSDSYLQAAELIPAAVKGFQGENIACVLKHFPGHGGTAEDSHDELAYVNRSPEELRAEELAPFRAGIEAGADAVMIGHLVVPEITDEPALFSHELVTDLLRGELGFRGVVMTDALNMKAITKNYSSGETAVKAVKAGVDMLLCPVDLDGSIQALMGAVENGSIPESRIDESVTRILLLKLERGIIPPEA